jgi:hypothetical protein
VKITVIATGFTGQIDVIGTLSYEPSARPVSSDQRQPAFTVGGKPTGPYSVDDLDIPAFLRDLRAWDRLRRWPSRGRLEPIPSS